MPVLSVAIVKDRPSQFGETCRESLARFTPELKGVVEVASDALLGFLLNQVSAPFVAVLDQRVAVSPGWAGRLIRAMQTTGAGAVGPLSNSAPGQQSRRTDYQDIPGFLTFAERVARDHAGQVQVVEALENFCILSRRDLLTGLDPRTPVCDLIKAVRADRHKLVIALDTYLHSFSGYHDHARPEVQRLIPPSARTVLDVGCGAGALGAALKRQGVLQVIGVEADPKAAEAARKVLDRVHLGDIEDLGLPYPPETFDWIVLADILEHLRGPWGVVKRLTPLLTPHGRVIASLPNVRHWSVLRGLLEGEWTYLPAGILDRGHLRFFTLRSGRALLEAADLTVIQILPICSGSVPNLAPLIDAGRSLSLDLSTLPEEAQITQYLFVAQRRV